MNPRGAFVLLLLLLLLPVSGTILPAPGGVATPDPHAKKTKPGPAQSDDEEKSAAEREKEAERGKEAEQERLQARAEAEQQHLDRTEGSLILKGGQRLHVIVISRDGKEIVVTTSVGDFHFREEDVQAFEYMDSRTRETKAMAFSQIEGRQNSNPPEHSPSPGTQIGRFTGGGSVKGRFTTTDGIFYLFETENGAFLFDRSQMDAPDVTVAIPPGPEPQPGENGIFVLTSGQVIRGMVTERSESSFTVETGAGTLHLDRSDLAYARKITGRVPLSD